MEQRIEKLESGFEEIYQIIKEMKNSLDSLISFTPPKKIGLVNVGIRTTPKGISTPMAGTHEKGANPWALSSAQTF